MPESDYEHKVETMATEFAQEYQKRQIEKEARYRFSLQLLSESVKDWDEELKNKKDAYESYINIRRDGFCYQHKYMINHECAGCTWTTKWIYYGRNLKDYIKQIGKEHQNPGQFPRWYSFEDPMRL